MCYLNGAWERGLSEIGVTIGGEVSKPPDRHAHIVLRRTVSWWYFVVHWIANVHVYDTVNREFFRAFLKSHVKFVVFNVWTKKNLCKIKSTLKELIFLLCQNNNYNHWIFFLNGNLKMILRNNYLHIFLGRKK